MSVSISSQGALRTTLSSHKALSIVPKVKSCLKSGISLRCRSRVYEKDGMIQVSKALTLLSSFAAAAILFISPVQAGVILEQPKLKSTFETRSGEVVKSEKKAEIKKALQNYPNNDFGDLGDSTGFISLGLSLVAISGAFVAAKKLDSGFSDFFERTSVKDSIAFGVGYEETLKEQGPMVVGSGPLKKKKR